MIRSISALLAVAAAVAFGACGSSAGDAAPQVTPATAKASIERAAHVELKAETVPADAREQGMTASYSNSATIVKDKQALAVFVMKDADVASEVTDRVRASAPNSAKLIAHRQVMVVYTPAGTDRTAAVKRAVKEL
jgi:CTP:molybdopterin cytidylyltransferase MocA